MNRIVLFEFEFVCGNSLREQIFDRFHLPKRKRFDSGKMFWTWKFRQEAGIDGKIAENAAIQISL